MGASDISPTDFPYCQQTSPCTVDPLESRKNASVRFSRVTRAARDPTHHSVTVDLQFGNRRTRQVGIRADLHLHKPACGLGISQALPLAKGFHTLPDMTIETDKITHWQIWPIRSLIPFRGDL